jgi:hypothetical protein
MFCIECGKEMNNDEEFCPNCGGKVDPLYKGKNFLYEEPTQEVQTDNLVKKSELPMEQRGFNWGAFLLAPIWGGINNVYIAFLWIFPLFTIPMSIVLGINGNKWAWQNKIWESEEEFATTQRSITKASFILVGILLLIIATITFIIFVYPSLVPPLRRFDPNANNI